MYRYSGKGRMNNINNIQWRVITVVFAVVASCIMLSGIVTQPWHVIPELGADGGKNIFTYLYHVQYDKGIWFSGMNYPYGEHIVYTDAQPVLSVPLSYIKVSIPVALSIMWWCISLSYVLSIVYCAGILRYFKVHPLPAMLFAGLITACSPQLLRVSGHFALSYACLLPMLFYWTLQYSGKPALRYLLYILLSGCFSVFLHPYYGAVMLIWAVLYSVGYVATGKGAFFARIKHVIPVLATAATILVVFGIVMRVTDPVKDRPAVPYGVLDHITHVKDVFSSVYSPFWVFVQSHTSFSKISAGGEGYTYPGLAVICCVMLSFAIWLWQKIRKHATIEKGFPAVWLIMAMLALLLGGGAPFSWGMAWLLDYASALRQFRTLGRFSWIFYYIITVYGAVTIYHWTVALMEHQQKKLAYSVFILFAAVWATEATGYIRHTHQVVRAGYDNYSIFTSANETNWQQILATHHYSGDSFQAVLVIPFFATGTEKLWVCSDENISAWSVAMAAKAGVQLHLPVMDVMMSRSSWSQAFRQVKIAGGPYTIKPVLYGLKDSRPLLLLHTDGSTLTPDQEYLLSSSVFIGHFLHCNVYACYPRQVMQRDEEQVNQAKAIAAALSDDRDTCINNEGIWFVAHYDNNNYNSTPFGTGALPYASSMNGVVCDVPVMPARNGQLYEFSCWFHVPSNDYRSPKCELELTDNEGKILTTVSASSIESTDNVVLRATANEYNTQKRDIWLRCNAYFELPGEAKHVRCRMLNFAEQPFMAVDEVMIRPAGSIIINRQMVNNHLLNNK